MRALVTTRNGDAEVLKVEERTDPVPTKDQVLIRVKAAGLNFADILARQGLYPDAPKKPCVVGYEISGVIEAIGPGVDAALLNLPVLALTRFGGQSDLVNVPTIQVFEKPESLSFEQAAAI